MSVTASPDKAGSAVRVSLFDKVPTPPVFFSFSICGSVCDFLLLLLLTISKWTLIIDLWFYQKKQFQQNLLRQ